MIVSVKRSSVCWSWVLSGKRTGVAWSGWRLARVGALALGLMFSVGHVAAEQTPEVADGAETAMGTRSLTAPIPAARQATNLAVITIRGPIDAITAKSVERRMQRAVDGGADGIVFDFDSPGGEVGAVLEITSMIKASPVANTIAWVNPAAYSGGAIVALACREIVLAPNATMGDAAPIMFDPIRGISKMTGTERQKALVPLLAEIVDSARLRGYDEKLVQGFVTLGVELWLIEDAQTGERHFIDAGEYAALFQREPIRSSPRIASGAVSGTGPITPEEHLEGAEDASRDTDEPVRARRGAMDSAKEFQPASPLIGDTTSHEITDALTTISMRPDFYRADGSRYRVVEYATDGNTLLTLKETELREYGFGVKVIRNDEELKAFVGSTNLRRLDTTWSERFVGFMTMGSSGMMIRGVLIVVFLLSLFIELAMPGVGIPGFIAMLALLGLVVPPMLIGAASWWAGAVILGGIAFILLELFVFPGFGIPGVLGLVMMLIGLVGTFAGADQLFPGIGNGKQGELAWAVSIVFLSVFVAGVGAYLFSRYTNRFPLAGKLVLTDQQHADGGASVSLLGAMGGASDGPVEAGAIGRTTTPLRPSGSAMFGDKLVDVVSEIGFIEQGTPVCAVRVSRYRVGVEPVRGDAGDEGAA